MTMATPVGDGPTPTFDRDEHDTLLKEIALACQEHDLTASEALQIWRAGVGGFLALAAIFNSRSQQAYARLNFVGIGTASIEQDAP